MLLPSMHPALVPPAGAGMLLGAALPPIDRASTVKSKLVACVESMARISLAWQIASSGCTCMAWPHALILVAGHCGSSKISQVFAQSLRLIETIGLQSTLRVRSEISSNAGDDNAVNEAESVGLGQKGASKSKEGDPKLGRPFEGRTASQSYRRAIIAVPRALLHPFTKTKEGSKVPKFPSPPGSVRIPPFADATLAVTALAREADAPAAEQTELSELLRALNLACIGIQSGGPGEFNPGSILAKHQWYSGGQDHRHVASETMAMRPPSGEMLPVIGAQDCLHACDPVIA